MSEWVHSTVGAVTAYQRAGGTPTATTDSFYGGDIPFVTIEDITNGTRFLYRTEKTLSNSGLANSAAWLIKDPHVLYSMYATVGKPIINRIACATNQAIIALKESPEIVQSFFFYQLLFMRPDVYKYTAQTTQSNLNAGSVKKLPISYPKDKREQRKIAAILTAADVAIEKTEALIDKYQQIKAGLMHDLFTRGVLPNGQLRPPRSEAPQLYQETAIGWAPRAWEVSKVENVLYRIIDYRGKTPEKTVSGIPLITAKNVRMGYIDPEPREFIAEAAYISWMTRGIPNKGDVLFTTEAPLGNVAQVPSDDRVAFAQRAIILQPSELIDATFLACRLMTEAAQNAIARLASGSTALGVKQSEFRKVCITFPVDRVEQKEIAQRLQAIDGFLTGQHNARRKLQNQKLGLMQGLLTGKVAVKVGTGEAANA